MLTAHAVEKAGGSVAKLAKIFDNGIDDGGISVQAVYKWGARIPRPRVYELRAKHPDWFEAESPPSPMQEAL